MRKIALFSLAALVASVSLAGCGMADTGSKKEETSASDDKSASAGDYVNVVKLTGIAWFDRMKTGVEDFAKESGKKAFQTGPDTNSPEKQVGIIQGLIAQKPAVLAIIPSDPAALDAVIKQATGAGIKVITQEAPALESPDADIEAFDNKNYGESIMGGLAKCMGEKGQYVQFVGTLTAATHMEWAQAGYDLQKEKYSGMERLGTEVESNNSADEAYKKTKQLLQANPELKGFQGGSSEDVIGIGRAIAEAGLQADTCVYGTGVPSQSIKGLEDGSIDEIYFWDPAAAGQAMMKAGQLLVEGKKIETGTDLGVEGYTKLTQSPTNPKVFYGTADLSATKDTVGKYNF
ncbi:MAG: autoinducer 2 ABC transporter substrate-binding protein [Actinomycetaceae bacterium]|nr:autoinducer 2 ABC transporter substrate-binding protein [Actinomycetaceae bacterium]